jgi:integrase
VKLHFSEEVLHALTATPAERRRRFTDLIQRGLVFDATPSGGYFYFRYTFAGRQRLLGLGKLGTADLGQIRQRVTELTHQLIDGHNPALIQGDRASTPSLGEFYRERYLPHVRTYKTTTINDSCYFVNHLLPFFGEIAMHRISRGEVSRFVSRKLEEGFKPSSINRYLVALRFAFNLALQWEVPGISKNPLHRYQLLKENNLINRFLTVEETLRLKATLADSANPDLASIVGFLLVTGARKTEVLEARWEQFDLERRQWRIPKSKSGYHRFIPISDAALHLLRKRQSLGINSPWLFPNPATGKPYVEIYNAWNTARRRAGLADLRIHDLRHSFASSLVNGGAPLYEVQKLLGHSNIRTTERYAHLAPERLLGSMRISDAAFGDVSEAASHQLELFA